MRTLYAKIWVKHSKFPAAYFCTGNVFCWVLILLKNWKGILKHGKCFDLWRRNVHCFRNSPGVKGFHIVRSLRWRAPGIASIVTHFQGSVLGINFLCALMQQPSRAPSCSRVISRLRHRNGSAVASSGVDQGTSSKVSLNFLKQLSNVTPELCELVKVDEGVETRIEARRS